MIPAMLIGSKGSTQGKKIDLTSMPCQVLRSGLAWLGLADWLTGKLVNWLGTLTIGWGGVLGPSVIPTVMPWLAGKASQPLTLSLSYVYSGEASEAGQRRRPEHIHVRCLSVPFVTLQVLTYGFVALAQCTATTPELNPPPPPHLTPNGFLVSVSRASGAKPYRIWRLTKHMHVM